MKTRIAALALASAALFANDASARTLTTVAACQLPTGEVAQMVTFTEFYNTGGLVYPGGSGDIPDFVADGMTSAHHSGYVTSSHGQHRFTGEGYFIDFGHRGPIFQVVWQSRNQYTLHDQFNSGWGVIPCYVQSMQ